MLDHCTEWKILSEMLELRAQNFKHKLGSHEKKSVHSKTPDRLNWTFSITLEHRLIQSASSGSTPLFFII